MCLLKSILATRLINGKTFASASTVYSLPLLFRNIKRAEVAFPPVAWGESRGAVVTVQPVNKEVK